MHNLGIEPLSVKAAALEKKFDAEDAYLAFRLAYFAYFSKDANRMHMIPWLKNYNIKFLSWMDNCHDREHYADKKKELGKLEE
jgi:hypothetical protein